MAEILPNVAINQGRVLPSLKDVFSTIPVTGSKFRRALSFFGPGYLIAVGYMDPGNWATDIYGGSAFGYTLLSVVLISSLMAMLLQHLAVRLGVATGRDLAQACREHYSRPVAMVLWILCEIAIVACDLAELIGTAIALQLLFGLPLVYGATLTLADVFIIFMLTNGGMRLLEAIVIAMLTSVFVLFAIQVFMASPDISAVSSGFAPSYEIISNKKMLFAAIGILGATVMPHNLYLHSSIVQSRDCGKTYKEKKESIFFATLDSNIAMIIAFFVNAAILIVAASAFHSSGHIVMEIQEAYHLLPAALGASVAATLFALALLASGQNSVITATMAGQIVMEGFIKIRLPHGTRRLITRGLALIPTIFVTIYFGEKSTAQLLFASQIVLSLQLPMAIIPLITFVSDRSKMGDLVIGPKLKALSILVCIVIMLANIKLIYDFV